MENQKLHIAQISKIFKGISEALIIGLLDKKLVNILRSYYDRIDESHLSTSLLSMFGCELFRKKKVINLIVDRMSPIEIERIIIKNGIKRTNNTYDAVKNYFRIVENIVSYFNLSDFFLKENPKDTRTVSELITPVYGEEVTSRGCLHPYQLSSKCNLNQRIVNSAGTFTTLLVMPTGSGKTRTAVEFIIEFIRGRRASNVVWIVNKNELLEQTLETVHDLWKAKGERKLVLNRYFSSFVPTKFSGDSITFAGFPKLIAERKSKSKTYEELTRSSDLVVIDEAHFTLAEEYSEVYRDFKSKGSNKIIIGLTATPMSPNDDEFSDLTDLYESSVLTFTDENNNEVSNPIEYLQDRNYLAELETEYILIEENKIDECNSKFNKTVINRIILAVEKEQQIIVFGRSKYHAIALDIILKEFEVKSACIVGETPQIDRQSIFKQFEQKKINVIVNEQILSTGIDLPKVDCIFILKKFENKATAMQVLGRALRGKENGGNLKNKVITITKNRELNDANDLYRLINKIS